MKIPISLIIDDPTPIISLYHYHVESRLTPDGRPLIPEYKNELLFEFCDVIERNGIKGKFSVVPMPANKGDIINGIEGVDKGDMTEWQECVKSRVAPHFSIGPEMLSHYKAVNLESGEAMELNERDWASTQDRKTLTPYIAKALSILDECGFKPTGVTSPWDFGIEVEDEYEYSISRAVLSANP
jgi:hypothetical protein